MERIQMQDMYCREIIEIKERPRHDNLKKTKSRQKNLKGKNDGKTQNINMD